MSEGTGLAFRGLLPSDVEPLAGLVAATGALLGVGLTWWNQRRQPARDRADAAESLAQAAADLVGPLQTEIRTLRAQQAANIKEIECLHGGLADLRVENEGLKRVIHRLEGRTTALMAGVRVLTDQIREAGLHPRWEPPSVEED